jgi:hypothetical protein
MSIRDMLAWALLALLIAGTVLFTAVWVATTPGVPV